MRKSLTRAFVAALLLAGALLTAADVDRIPELRDVDEAAWLFNGAYLELYRSGDWQHPDWNAFDKYAQHPPAGAYLFGVLLHVIGEPMTSMEPRRYWFENDLDLVLVPQRFLQGLYERFTPRQLIAGRYMSAGIGWLAAVALLLLAWRLAGPLAGCASFALLILHPAFREVATLCSIETTIMLLSILAVFFTWEMGCAFARRPRWAVFWCLLAGICLGSLLATKISAIPWLAAIAMAAVAGAEGSAALRRSLLGIVAIAFMAFGIAVLLDPGLQEAPIVIMKERLDWRFLRIDIQRLVFVGASIQTIAGRLAFAAFWTFFASAVASVVFFLTAVGVVGRAFSDGIVGARQQGLIVVLAVYAFFLSLVTLPLAWMRYVATSVPFVVLLAGLGAGHLWKMLTCWRTMSQVRRGMIAAGLLGAAILTSALTLGYERYRWQTPPLPSPQQVRISRMFAFSLAHPGSSAAVHRELLLYFEGKGDVVWADYQRHWMEEMNREREER